MKVLFAYADTPEEWNTSQWRCVLPAQAIAQIPGWETNLVGLMELARGQRQDLVEWAEVIVVERLLIMEILTMMECWKAMGKTVLGTIDDDYQHMPRSVTAYSFWHQGAIVKNGKTINVTPPPIEQLTWGAKLVDGLLVASKQLLEDWKRVTPYTYWFPNFMDSERYIQVRRIEHDPEHLVIGWGGSFTHVESWKQSGILQALSDVFQARPKIQLLLAGGDERIFDLIRIHPSRKHLVRWQNVQVWPSILAQFDIGLIPLAGVYDQRRSWIKAIEYMVMGIPWVGSDCVTLQDVGDLGILVQNNHQSWRKGLIHLIDRYPEYLERAQGFANEYPRVDISDQGYTLARIIEKAVTNRERKLL